MRPTENGQLLLSRVREYLLSLPFDLKVLQEILTNDELPKPIREQAAGVLLQHDRQTNKGAWAWGRSPAGSPGAVWRGNNAR